ncbi:LacI family DNA-binding transcriptional regulator [Streptomyces sp. 3MP-14]|uniref:LacI family DNA-binding transcriptional regulator n=1 Tax=Streptomyces mimosae TaxID=2586635 RepID=A0A5N6AFY5_9ACTN|nr:MULTISPECIES: LacI family DNA-binding transcriptional regulator [Streptomyces]KAB8166973.1 LacI family DNA-binding transcriptional regulator [Streptomyces mimosae]KAB8176914.1 LacI family DNA-binding transcriptional regulator [Streptomyces sp. 3MP-14]
MPDGQRAVTITEVATRAGVSISTASKALNGRGQLRDETRERVFAAANELGYQPNALARSLVQRRSFTVGLLSTESADRFNIPLHMGIENALGAGRVSVFLCDGRADPLRERFYLDSLLSRRVDGIVVTGVRTDARPPLSTVPLPVPVVYAYSRSADPNDLSVLPDDEHGGRLAAEHLLSAGWRTFAHITGPMDFAAARDRLAGFRATLADAGLELPDRRVYSGPWRESFGRDAAADLLDRHPEVDAVFCGSDQVARGVLDTLRERGRRVPEEVGVVGFDNWGVLTEDSRPPLTSVDMNLQELGELAARRLLSMIEGHRESGLIRHPCRLEVRASGGAPAPHVPGGIRPVG